MFETGQTILDVYVVEKFLGAGGTGEVFRVRRTLDGMRYAVKTIHSSKVRSLALRRDLLREIRVSRAMSNHPHIVPSRFFRITDGSVLVFSDYVGGGTLDEWIRRLSVDTPAKIIDTAIQIARGIQAAHGGGIIHKDIKPANVLMESDGRARVADFGLIRGMTPSFCSPEQMSDTGVTPATDIYSWALVVMVMWLGKVKWMLGPQAVEVCDILKDPEWRPGPAPGTLRALLRRCLSIDPGARPDAAGVIAELKAIYREVTGKDYPHPDPPDDCRGDDTDRVDPGRVSIMDGMILDDPRKMLDFITERLESSSIDVGSLVPELKHPPETFVDSLHVYLFVEDILRKVASEGDPEWLLLLTKALKQKAWLLVETGDYAGAGDAHLENTRLLQELIQWHGRGDLWKELAGNYCELATCLRHLDRVDEALKCCDEARNAMDCYPESMRNDRYYYDDYVILTNHAIVLARAEQNEEAASQFAAAVSVLETVSDAFPADKLHRVKSQAAFNLGTHLQRMNRARDGVTQFQRALEWHRRLSEFSDNDRLYRAAVCQNLGIGLAQLERHRNADFFFREAAECYENILNRSSHPFVKQKYAHFLSNYSYFTFETGAVETAVERAEHALALFLELVQTKGFVDCARLIATVYGYLAEFHTAAGRSLEAENARKEVDRWTR